MIGGVFVDPDSRTLRILRDDITQAKQRLCAARQDGNCEQIRKAAKHLDEKLDRYSELTKQPQETAP